MTVTHRLVGYDRKTERMAVEHDIPAVLFPFVKSIVQFGPDDPDALDSYALDAGQALAIAGKLGQGIDPSRCDFFVEAFAPPRRARKVR